MAEVYNKERKGDVILLTLVQDLKQHLDNEGISVNELARRSGISNATVSRTLSYKTYPSFGVIYELYKTLNIELNVVQTIHEKPEEKTDEEV